MLLVLDVADERHGFERRHAARHADSGRGCPRLLLLLLLVVVCSGGCGRVLGQGRRHRGREREATHHRCCWHFVVVVVGGGGGRCGLKECATRAQIEARVVHIRTEAEAGLSIGCVVTVISCGDLVLFAAGASSPSHFLSFV